MTSPLCQCDQDGFCPRYGREMRGRFRQICRGIDVDLGTAAAFRAQWASESGGRTASGGEPTPIILQACQAPGDAVVATAAIYSLHRAHPGQYLTAVESPHVAVFAHNPDMVDLSNPRLHGAARLQMHYPAVRESCDRGIHFMQAYCEHLGDALGVHVPLLTERPRLYFGVPAPLSRDDYWLVCAGVKSDFTAKRWDGYQEVVHLLKGRVQFLQVGAVGDKHPRLEGAEDLVGRTTLRDLFSLARRARGVLCGTTLLMHVAAALEVPAVVVAGGREPVAWNAYPKMRYFHTIGALPCPSWRGRQGEACWRSNVPIGASPPDANTCVAARGGLPECMRIITTDSVAEAVLLYDSNGSPRHGVVG